MANLPAQHPNLSLQLADRSTAALITSARSQPQAQALASLTSTALMAHETALRLGLGSPQRIMVEHEGSGPLLLHSFVSPATSPPTTNGRGDASAALPLLDVDYNGRRSHAEAGARHAEQQQAGPDAAEGGHVPPMLLSTVVAPNPDLALEARRAGARLERVGKVLQSKWRET